MVDITITFFLIMSFLVLVYLIIIFKSDKRAHFFLESSFIGIYGLIFLIFLFPNIVNLIEKTFRIKSAINFILYFSIFVAYFIIFLLYRKMEAQRIEITKLVREIALMGKKNEKK